MTFVDAGYLLALFNRRDQLYKRAAAWSAVVADPCVVTEYVLCEVVNTYSRPAHRSRAYAIVAYVQSNGEFELVSASEELFAAGLQLHRERPDKAWSLTDCISFIVMEQRGITRALSHDRHFEQAGFEALLRRDP